MNDSPSKIILTVFVSIALLIDSVMLTSMVTRRTADEISKIKAADQIGKATESERLDACMKSGGRPDWYDGRLVDCNKNK